MFGLWTAIAIFLGGLIYLGLRSRREQRDREAEIFRRPAYEPEPSAEVVAAERELEELFGYLGPFDTWSEPERAEPLFHRVRRTPPDVHGQALARLARRVKRHRRLFSLAMKLGIDGTPERLARLFEAYADKFIAADFINTGNPLLAETASAWAARNGLRIIERPGAAPVRWGEF